MWLVRNIFISSTEWDVYTRDSLRICTLTKESIRKETVPLRKD